MSELSTAIEYYHSLLDPTAAQGILAHLTAGQRARGMLVGPARDRLICAVLRPRFVTETQYAALTRAATLVGRAIRKVGAATLADPSLLEPYQLNATERALLTIDPGYRGASMFGRLDGFMADDGDWCYFIESNLESPAGIAYDEALASMFDELPIMEAFRATYQAESLPMRPGLHQLLLDTFHAWGGTGAPTIAIVDFQTVVTNSEFVYLRDAFSAAGTPTVIADPSELRYDGTRLYARDMPVDLVYRRMLQHEFLAQYGLDHPLVRAYADHAVCVVNPFTSKPVHTKLIMALLSDEDGPAAAVLDAEERAAVTQHIPWSRHVRAGSTRYAGERIDLLTWAGHNRERLVLKPNDDYGGKGVVLGWETSAAEWEAALQAAQYAPFVVQERVPLPTELYPTWSSEAGLQFTQRYVDSDPLVYGDHATGCLTRIAATSLLNVSAGGGAAPPTFLVKRKTSV